MNNFQKTALLIIFISTNPHVQNPTLAANAYKFLTDDPDMSKAIVDLTEKELLDADGLVTQKGQVTAHKLLTTGVNFEDLAKRGGFSVSLAMLNASVLGLTASIEKKPLYVGSKGFELLETTRQTLDQMLKNAE